MRKKPCQKLKKYPLVVKRPPEDMKSRPAASKRRLKANGTEDTEYYPEGEVVGVDAEVSEPTPWPILAFVINLKSSVERWQHMQRELTKFGLINVKRFNAVNGVLHVFVFCCSFSTTFVSKTQ